MDSPLSAPLIVADLVFNFEPETSWWTHFMVRRVMRLKDLVGMSPFFRLMIRDRVAFARSIRAIMERDFERVIVAHGEPIPRDGKKWMTEALSRSSLSSGREN